jgi:hypothetical protein
LLAFQSVNGVLPSFIPTFLVVASQQSPALGLAVLNPARIELSRGRQRYQAKRTLEIATASGHTILIMPGQTGGS